MKRRKRALWSHPFKPTGYQKLYLSGETLEACGMCGFPWDEHEDNPEKAPCNRVDQYSMRAIGERSMQLWPTHFNAPVRPQEAQRGTKGDD